MTKDTIKKEKPRDPRSQGRLDSHMCASTVPAIKRA
jgi:hypothetical protein